MWPKLHYVCKAARAGGDWSGDVIFADNDDPKKHRDEGRDHEEVPTPSKYN